MPAWHLRRPVLCLSNKVLIIAGTLDGFSGFILSILMCRAMNRSMTERAVRRVWKCCNIDGAAGEQQGAMREVSMEDIAVQMAYAKQVVFVPGYGMATAQAQHAVRELADTLEKRGVTVKYGIHPVAGRMPGHMNVLLAEANVPYSSLYELEQINPEFPSTDVAVVIGANDVVNPDARDNPRSPIAGMPILEVDRAKSVVVLKRGQGKGFSGLENPLFFKEVTGMLYGDAKETLTTNGPGESSKRNTDSIRTFFQNKSWRPHAKISNIVFTGKCSRVSVFHPLPITSAVLAQRKAARQRRRRSCAARKEGQTQSPRRK